MFPYSGSLPDCHRPVFSLLLFAVFGFCLPSAPTHRPRQLRCGREAATHVALRGLGQYEQPHALGVEVMIDAEATTLQQSSTRTNHYPPSPEAEGRSILLATR